MTGEFRKKLLQEAMEARRNAIAPFSSFEVGAALATKDGKIFRGCNVENATFGLTVCAERVALLTALAAGERKFTAVAVVTRSEDPSAPCGSCRQLLWEFGGDLDLVLANVGGKTKDFKLSDLFPLPFNFHPGD